MSGTLSPTPRQQFFDADDRPASGCLLYTKASGLDTALAAYQNSALSTPHTNPIVLDAHGMATIYLAAHSYKYRLHTSDDEFIWEVDPVQAVAPHSVNLDIDGVAGQALNQFDIVYLSGGDSGTTPGRWYRCDADDVNKSSLAPMVGMVPDPIAQGATGTIRLQGRLSGMSALNAGATYYVSGTAGALTASAPANVRLVGVADSSTSLVLFAAAAGNVVTVSEIGFVPLESSTGNQGDIIATINASTEGGGTLKVAAAKIQISGSTTFAAGYDPTGKIAAAGAAADINANVTTISGGKITALSIAAAQLAADSVTATKILAGAIDATKLNVATLSAITANLGTVTAGSITGVTITGATMTAGGGTVTLDSNGIQVTASLSGTATDFHSYQFTGLTGGGQMWLAGTESATVRSLYLISRPASGVWTTNIGLQAARTDGSNIGSITISVPDATASIATIVADNIRLIGPTAVTGVLSPATTSTYDIGTSSKKWNTAYLTLASGGTVPVYTDATGALFFNASSRTVKRDIAPVIGSRFARILDLDPITYRWKNQPHMDPQVGLIAEDVRASGLGEFVVEHQGVPVVAYDRLVVYLLPIVKSLSERLQALEAA